MGKAELRIEIDAMLLEQARAAGVDVDALTEQALKDVLGAQAGLERAERWAKDNAEAIRDHRERIARYGAFGDDLRTW